MSDTLVVAAHPHLEHSRVTRTLLGRARAAALPGVTITDLYARYPDYHVDVAAEQRALAAAGNLVWLHPIHWYSMPPLLKLWLDEVFTFGWAYGPGGDALAGKRLWLVTSTGGGVDSYGEQGHHRHALADFLLPIVQTARLTRMCLLEPLVLHAAHRAGEAELAAHAAAFVEGLARLSRDEASVPPVPGAELVPADERPAA
jgi:glutathione-regulated potassium-efflux system ancillary protein KefF